MPTVTATKKKSVKHAVPSPVKTSHALTGQALLTDMKLYHKKVSATPKSARDFLTRLGVMTPSGKSKKLIRA